MVYIYIDGKTSCRFLGITPQKLVEPIYPETKTSKTTKRNRNNTKYRKQTDKTTKKNKNNTKYQKIII